MILDLRKGFGDFPEYSLTKFPDNSIKFIYASLFDRISYVRTTLRSNDDIIALCLVNDYLQRNNYNPITLYIDYMMYQQDDRLFAENESFGLAVIANILNTLSSFNKISIFAPHSDKVEMIKNCVIRDNTVYIGSTLGLIKEQKLQWVIPDSGAFKTQMKQIEKLQHQEFITCMKSRNHVTGNLTTIVNTNDLQGKPCLIVDDICLGGRTFINIAEELIKKNCGDLYLFVSHGVFNYGIENLLKYFKKIYTTDSICKLTRTKTIEIIPIILY